MRLQFRPALVGAALSALLGTAVDCHAFGFCGLLGHLKHRRRVCCVVEAPPANSDPGGSQLRSGPRLSDRVGPELLPPPTPKAANTSSGSGSSFTATPIAPIDNEINSRLQAWRDANPSGGSTSAKQVVIQVDGAPKLTVSGDGSTPKQVIVQADGKSVFTVTVSGTGGGDTSFAKQIHDAFASETTPDKDSGRKSLAGAYRGVAAVVTDSPVLKAGTDVLQMIEDRLANQTAAKALSNTRAIIEQRLSQEFPAADRGKTLTDADRAKYKSVFNEIAAALDAAGT